MSQLQERRRAVEDGALPTVLPLKPDRFVHTWRGKVACKDPEMRASFLLGVYVCFWQRSVGLQNGVCLHPGCGVCAAVALHWPPRIPTGSRARVVSQLKRHCMAQDDGLLKHVRTVCRAMNGSLYRPEVQNYCNPCAVAAALRLAAWRTCL